MIVDEPTTGLDPEERVRFRNLLADLSRQDMIILLSTHIVGDISSTCANVALLDLGKIVFNGTPDELVSAAKGKVWKVLASEAELDQLKEEYSVISAIPSEKGYELRLVADRIKEREAIPIDPNIEDAYVFFMKSIGYKDRWD